MLFSISGKQTITISKEDPQTTIGWKEYRNDEFRFSFKYPEGLLSNFSVLKNDLGTTTYNQISKSRPSKKTELLNPSGYNVIFEAGAAKSGENLDNFLKHNLPETKDLKRQKIILDDMEGVRITNIEEEKDAYFIYNLFEKNGVIYNFALLSDDPVLIRGNTPLLEDILSTARFD